MIDFKRMNLFIQKLNGIESGTNNSISAAADINVVAIR